MKEGVFVHGTSLYLKLLPPTPTKSAKTPEEVSEPGQFSFVIPNKIKKTSVGRHLIKRRLTAAVEKLLITIKPGFSAIIFVKKDISTLPFTEVEKEVVELLKKAKIL